MKHIELIKLREGVDPVEIQEKLWKTCRRLDDELDWLNHPVVFRASGGCDSDFDLMVVLEMESEERLPEYRAHPLTLKLEGRIGEAVAKRKQFNHY